MKKIDETTLQKWQENYELEKSHFITKQALAKNAINSICINQQQINKMEQLFNINLETLPVTNQESSGRCWIFAGCNIIRERLAKKYNLENFELSQSYLAFYDKLEKSNYFMETIRNLKDTKDDERIRDLKLETALEDGGQWDMFVALVKKYGVVPKNVMKETYQSSHTDQLNHLISTKLRQFASFVLEKRTNLDALQEKTLQDIYTILIDCYGIPPKEFTFEYVDKNKQYHAVENLTPKDFYEQYCDIDLEDYISIIHAPTKDKPYHRTFTVKYLGNVIEAPNIKYLNLPLEEFKQLIITQLQSLEPVWFGSDCTKAYEKTEGIWDSDMMDYDTTFQMEFYMSKENRLLTFESTMNHAMVFTGVQLVNGKSLKWKIENSWGKEKGKDGYYVASDKWFDEYVYQAVVHKKYLKANLTNILQEDPIVLMPWDPFGTLA